MIVIVIKSLIIGFIGGAAVAAGAARMFHTPNSQSMGAFRTLAYHACQRDFGTIVQAVCLDHCCQYRAKRHQLTDADARTLRIDAPTHQTLEIPSV